MDAEGLHEVEFVKFDGFGGNFQNRTDLLIGATLCYQLEHLPLPRREAGA